MTKFNVGDKVRFIEDYMDYKKGDIVEVTGFWSEGINYIGKGKSIGCYFNRVELAESKPTKNQRITALEKEVSELKLIVHELRGRQDIDFSPLCEPSTTNNVEDIIEFEGAKYRKVDRLAEVGDVVVFNSKMCPNNANMNEPYIVNRETSHGVGHYDGTTVCDVKFVIYDNGRSTKTVDVYELIVEDKSKIRGITIEIDKPLSPNEQRAQIIEDAKKFVEENSEGFTFDLSVENAITTFRQKWSSGKVDIQFGAAYRNPSDVFNDHIGKAIALGRALNLDVSKFEQAVQPTKAVYGMIVEQYKTKGAYREVAPDFIQFKTCQLESDTAKYGRIINDTNAIYGGVE
ncbi:hypothetical protein ACIQ2D_08785 [Lysinibacillus sp. NPDC097287]|uniref:hypothetical protein n=1 Tax=Lysinibacillus sp. NPDC097287 TaxID=3364144 RepID=UPI003810D672